MQHEALQHKLPELHFRPEGYTGSGDEEFLNQLLSFLSARGLEPDQLLFSGFDGTKLKKGEPMPRYNAVFAMNEAGWREALRLRDLNPASYAEDWDTPCIALYDKGSLAEAYSYDFDNADSEEDTRLEFKNIVVGEALSDVPADKGLEEAFVHKDYPDGSPTDALVGLVFIER